MTDLYGCSDHGCMYGHPGGMGTNGGCRCEKALQRRGPEGVKAARQIRLLRAEHDALQADAERYRWLLNEMPRIAWEVFLGEKSGSLISEKLITATIDARR